MNERQTRIWQAQRAGLAARLRDTLRISPDRVEALIEAWEAEAVARGLAAADGYWSAAETWLAERLAGVENGRPGSTEGRQAR
jgi:hypothetical protein